MNGLVKLYVIIDEKPKTFHNIRFNVDCDMTAIDIRKVGEKKAQEWLSKQNWLDASKVHHRIEISIW